jgi:hypothetical protein
LPRHKKRSKVYKKVQGLNRKTAKSFFKLWTGAYGGAGGFPRRRFEHPGTRLSGRKTTGGLGDFREGLTDGINEEGRAESERSGRRRRFRGGRLGPSSDGAHVAFRRRGGAADVRLGVANFTASLIGSGERPRRRTEAAADR